MAGALSYLFILNDLRQGGVAQEQHPLHFTGAGDSEFPGSLCGDEGTCPHPVHSEGNLYFLMATLAITRGDHLIGM